jgi:hypothetical protein
MGVEVQFHAFITSANMQASGQLLSTFVDQNSVKIMWLGIKSVFTLTTIVQNNYTLNFNAYCMLFV